MIRRIRHGLWLTLLCVLCQWLAPAAVVPLGAVYASVAGVSCNGTITNLSFGNVDPTSSGLYDNAPTGGNTGSLSGNTNANLQTTGYLTYYCTNTNATPQSITICVSIGNRNRSAQRSMSSANSNKALNYQLYQDAAYAATWGSAYANTWGNPYSSTINVPANGTSAPLTVPIYAVIAQSQNNWKMKSPGPYNDSYGNSAVKLDTSPSGTGCQTYSSGNTISGFTVSANVQATCYVSTNLLTFPTSPSGTARTITATTTLTVNCADGDTFYDIGLDNGQNYGMGSASGARAMRGGPTFSGYISYDLYADSGYQNRWGNNYGVDTYRAIGPTPISSNQQTFTVYGRVLTTPSVPGNYYDAVTVYVYY